MKDENHEIKNLQKQDKWWEINETKRWETDIKFGVFKFKEIRERFESFELEILHFCCSHLRGWQRICTFSLYKETKFLISSIF